MISGRDAPSSARGIGGIKLPKVTRGVPEGSWTSSGVRLSAHDRQADWDMNTPCFLALVGLLWRCCAAQQRGECVNESRVRAQPAGSERALRALRVHVAIYSFRSEINVCV